MANKVVFDVLANTQQFKGAMGNIEGQAKKTSGVLSSTFGKFVGLAGLTAGVYSSLNAFKSFETGLIGVAKTANFTAEQSKAFGKEIEKLSTIMPISNAKLLEYSQTAGQFGLQGTKAILEFTTVLGKLESATDIVGAEGASSIKRFLDVAGNGIKDLQLFGNVIVGLGNNIAATENEILSMASRIAQDTAIYKLGTKNVLGLSAGIRSLGIPAERAGTVIGVSFQKIEKAIQEGGESLKELMRLTGMTRDELRKTFEEDATQVFLKFTEGLEKSKANGELLSTSLEKMSLTGTRASSVLGTIAKNSQSMRDAMALANEETLKQDALNKEYANTLVSVDSKLQLAKNSLFNLGKTVFSIVAPAFKLLLTAGADVLNMFVAITSDPILKWVALFTVGIYGVVKAWTLLNTVIKKNWIVLAISSAIIAISQLYKHWDTVVKFLKVGWLGVKEVFMKGGIVIKSVMVGITNSFLWMVEKVYQGLSLVDSAYQKDANSVAELRNKNKQSLKDMEEDWRSASQKRKELQSELFGGTSTQEGVISTSSTTDAFNLERQQPAEQSIGAMDNKSQAEIEAMKEADKQKLEIQQAYYDARNEKKGVQEAIEEARRLELEEIEMTNAEARLQRLDEWYQQELSKKDLTEKEKDRIDQAYYKQREKLEGIRFKKQIKDATARAKAFVGVEQLKFGLIKDILQKGAENSKTMAKLNQKVMLGQAVMNTALGVAKALGSAPFPINIVNAALVGAAGAMEISTIKKQSFAVGTDFVPNDMVANIHKGEGIIPAKENQFLQSGKVELVATGSRKKDNAMNINVEISNNTFQGTDDDMIDRIENAIVEKFNTIGSQLALGSV